MATLQKIRNRGPLIAIVIGVALLAFLLGDVNQLFSGQGDMNVAIIDGTEVSIQEYQSRYTNYEEGLKLITGNTQVDTETQDYIKSQVWDKLIKNYSLTESYEDLGIDVSDMELAKIISGENIQNGIDPLTRQVFTDPQTGQFNPQYAVNFFTQANQTPEGMQVAAFLEQELKDNRKYTKYTNLISQGLNITSLEAEKLYFERVEMTDFDYSVKKYNSIPDSTINVSEKELKNFYDDHKEEYEQDASRDIAYIVFNVVPSETDKAVALEDLKYYEKEFAEINTDSTQEDIINYVNANSQTPFNFVHLNLEELGDTALFYADYDSVAGPVLENGSYVLKRIFDRRMMPDTVEARHILIRPDGQAITNMDRAKEIADSLKTLVENGADFAELAKNNSADGSAQNGGDLGKFTEGQMVREFSDACFNGKVGDLVIVESQFGVHLIEITDQSKERQEKVRLAVMSIIVRPGNNTISEYFAAARDFAVKSENNLEKFDELIEKEGFTKRIATDIAPETEVIAGIENPSAIINWVYNDETAVGSVSSPFQDGDFFYVVAVTSIREEGIAPFVQVEEDITARVIKKKKGEILAEEMKGINTFEKSAKNISFSSSRLNDDGIEYAVIATATESEKDMVVGPIIGENGVYVLKIISKTGIDNTDNLDFTNDRNNALRRLSFRITRQLFDAINEAADVEDNRHKFF